MMRDRLPECPAVTLRPIFVEVMPPFDSIKDGELWVSHKHRTINLRCPCGCGELTVLSLHPSRWHVYFDGKSVSLKGPTGGVNLDPFQLRQPLFHTKQRGGLVVSDRSGTSCGL